MARRFERIRHTQNDWQSHTAIVDDRSCVVESCCASRERPMPVHKLLLIWDCLFKAALQSDSLCIDSTPDSNLLVTNLLDSWHCFLSVLMLCKDVKLGSRNAVFCSLQLLEWHAKFVLPPSDCFTRWNYKAEQIKKAPPNTTACGPKKFHVGDVSHNLAIRT